jgi:hypothetical protein
LGTAYDVTIIRVRPGTHPKALEVLAGSLGGDPDLLACWYADIGALNRIMCLRRIADPAQAIARRQKLLDSDNPFGLGDMMTGMSMDTFVALDFLPPIQPGALGPCYEVRSYELTPGGHTPTVESWRKAVPARIKISPLLIAMTSVTGALPRLIHIWPYKSLEERARLRAKAVADGVWPPKGGGPYMATQQTDIYLPAPFSPLR